MPHRRLARLRYCPHCGHVIIGDSPRCPFCSAEKPALQRAPSRRTGIALTVIVIIALASLLLWN
jgi:hypothetical protein